MATPSKSEIREHSDLARKRTWKGNFELSAIKKARLKELEETYPSLLAKKATKFEETKEDMIFALKQELTRLKKSRDRDNPRVKQVEEMLLKLGASLN